MNDSKKLDKGYEKLINEIENILKKYGLYINVQIIVYI